jgi:3-methyladenine DNA glycosylase AlkD
MADDVDGLIAELAELGTERNRAIYRRHGAREPIFGVSYKDIGVLAKRVGRDQKLADELWRSGNHDARVLAAQIADGSLIDRSTAGRWIADVDNYVLVLAVVRPLADAPGAVEIARDWRAGDGEWMTSAGWALTAYLAMRRDALDDAECEDLLATIEHEIAGAPNRTRHEMNGALIAIGSRGGRFDDLAREVAARIGPVSVDHGLTGCKTPAAISYLDRIAARRSARG